MTNEEFDDLASSYLDGALAADRMPSLNQALSTDPNLAARFVWLGRIHAGLRELRRVPTKSEREEKGSGPNLEATGPARPRAFRAFSLASAAMAALLLLALAYSLFTPEITQAPQVGQEGAPGALLVVGRVAPLGPGDMALRDRLARLGFRVTPLKESMAGAKSAEGQALIVISESVVSSELGNRLADVPLPILNCEPNLNAAVRITTKSASPNEIFLRGKQKAIRMTDPSHPLAAGLEGSVTVYSGREGFLTWGVPDEKLAHVIARCDTKEGEPTIFSYEPGKAARGADLPARRLSFFLASNTEEAERLTADGWKLFDAAVNWLVPKR